MTCSQRGASAALPLFQPPFVGGGCPLAWPIIAINNVLSFVDVPNDTALQGVAPSINPPAGQFSKFQTSLVGVSSTQLPGRCPCGPGNPGSNSGYASMPYCTVVYPWSWNSTYSSTARSGGVSQYAMLYPAYPGNGTGGVTIENINGMPQTPPSVSCTATPNTLWPPNSKTVLVTVSGTITPGTQAIPSGDTIYGVIDSYGQAQPSGSIALAAGGSYSFRVSLVAARNGDDRDGRTYTIVVGARDMVGNIGSCSAAVTVRHDQGNQI